MVDHINNGESGLSVREKLNEVIDRTNTLNGSENQIEANKNLGQQNSARIDKTPNAQAKLVTNVLKCCQPACIGSSTCVFLMIVCNMYCDSVVKGIRMRKIMDDNKMARVVE